jgi:hypothetical protein
VGQVRGPLNLVSTIEELFGRKSSGSGLENQEYGRRDSSRWPRGTIYQQKLALTSLTGGWRSVGVVRLRTQATGFSFSLVYVKQIIYSGRIHNIEHLKQRIKEATASVILVVLGRVWQEMEYRLHTYNFDKHVGEKKLFQ